MISRLMWSCVKANRWQKQGAITAPIQGWNVSIKLAALWLACVAAPVWAQADGQGVASHVVVISIDGLRADAIERYQPPTLVRLRTEGASAEAHTILPSKTLPSHTSMLTGVTPEVHGITWNSEQLDERGYVRVPTVFEVASGAGLTAAAFFSKAKLRHLLKPGTISYAQAPRGDLWPATRTVADVTHYLKFNRPNLLFIHVAEPDYAGHSLGWMRGWYGWAVRRADAAVAHILAAAESAYGAGNYTVIVTADHGGHGRAHGTDAENDTAIPWIVWGRGIERGQCARGVKTMDTAATVLWLLGVARPETWSGRVVREVFSEHHDAPLLPI
jgi:arylsulfatase A-like enzyme